MVIRRSFFGNPPFRTMVHHLVRDDDFLEDARYILDLDEESYLQLATRLSTTDAFLDHSELETLVNESVKDDPHRIAAIIYKLSEFLHMVDMDILDAMAALGQSIKENAKSFSIQEQQTLINRLNKLVAEPTGIGKQFKAQHLVEAIGAELDDFRLICDIRPIFDQSRERIEGAVPIATLRLEYTDPDGDSGVTEMRITEKQVAKFSKEIENASLKFKMIKQLLEDKEISAPRTKSTLNEDM